MSLPLLWISWFGQRTISIRRRLYEEYNHKEKVMKIFSGLNPEIGDETQKQKLLDIVLNTIAENPAHILGKGETLLDKLLDEVKYLRIKKILHTMQTDQ